MAIKKKIIISITLIFIGFAVALPIVLIKNKDSSPISKATLNEVNYPVFYPSNLNGLVLDKQSIKYNQQNKYINFVVHDKGIDLTFSEQATPDSFTFDSNLYPQFVAKFNSYDSFSSLDGTVYLTKLSKANYQTAIMNTKGTLLFVRTDNGLLSQSAWKLIFNTIKYDLPS